jgi:transcriptional regulator with XRE-family HTH domain
MGFRSFTERPLPPDVRLGFPGRLRAARLDLGLTQAALAAQIGHTHLYVSSLERGETLPTVAALLDLSERLGVTMNWLLRGADPLARFFTPEAS